MNYSKRKFLKNGLLSAVGLSLIDPISAWSGVEKTAVDNAFKLKFSPDFGVFSAFSGNDVLDQIHWGHDNGFRAWENTMLKNRPVAEQEKISQALQKHGMDFGQFVGTLTFSEVTFAGNNQEARNQVLKDINASVEIAKRMNTKYVHNVLGAMDPKLPYDFQMANAIELLKRIAEIYEKHDLVMVMESMNHKINHPGMFLHTIPQAYSLAKAVASPSLKILFDIYHVQIQEGNILPTMDHAWDEIAYFQLGDSPGRYEPGTGEINYYNVLNHIIQRGYRGFLGLEHRIKGTGKEGAMSALQQYKALDKWVSQENQVS